MCKLPSRPNGSNQSSCKGENDTQGPKMGFYTRDDELRHRDASGGIISYPMGRHSKHQYRPVHGKVWYPCAETITTRKMEMAAAEERIERLRERDGSEISGSAREHRGVRIQTDNTKRGRDHLEK